MQTNFQNEVEVSINNFSWEPVGERIMKIDLVSCQVLTIS